MDASSRVSIAGTLTNDGHVQVNGGILSADVAIDNRSAQTLAGTGHILAPVVTSSGGIEPGDPAVNGGIGTLHFGSLSEPTVLSLEGGSSATVEIGLGADLAQIFGDLELPTGISLAHQIALTLEIGVGAVAGTYPLFDYTGTLTGDVGNLLFESVTPGWEAQIIDNPGGTSIDVEIGPVPEAATAMWGLCTVFAWGLRRRRERVATA